jgi:hypothetical protein
VQTKKWLPWAAIGTVGLAVLPIIVEFKPAEVWTILQSWKSVACLVIPTLLVASVLLTAFFVMSEKSAGPPSQHDVDLFRLIDQTLDDAALTFLAHHDWRVDAHAGQLQPITTMSYWHGPNYIFVDKAIQKRWVELFSKILKLSDRYGSNLINSENDVERLTAWHLGFARNAQPPQAFVEIRELNEAAAAVYVDFGRFALYARKRLCL